MWMKALIGVVAVVCGEALLPGWATVIGQVSGSVVPLVPGLTFVLAMHVPPTGVSDIAVGDYEMVVAITAVDSNGLELSTSVEAMDEAGKPLQLTVRRRIRTIDLATARTQILGFHSADPLEIPGTTSLGPSLAIVRELHRAGRTTQSVRNFRHLSSVAGTLTRVGSAPVPFPVLVNGRRVELPAIRVTGQLVLENSDRRLPWEISLLDHSQHPITLRFAHGAFGDGIPFTARTVREVVRIDFPTAGDGDIEASLTARCRAEVPGIYFDVDRATLNPQSNRALTTIARLLQRQPQWRLSIEGHTDGNGTDAYNLDLSARRARAVTDALVREHSIASERLTPAGFGERRPVDTNDTIAGRARNRRVELVRQCSETQPDGRASGAGGR